MNWNILPDFLSLFPLGWAAYLLLGERRQFRSLVPFIVGVLLLFTSRLGDVLIGSSSAVAARMFDISQQGFVVVVNGLGNLSDAVGALFLVFGFVQTINFQRATEKRIQSLESLLPICAWCKNYRTADGTWKPIEEYLIESGSPELTHGICPTCAAKRRDNTQKSKHI